MICPAWGRNPGTHRRPYERVPQECPNRVLAPHLVSTLSILMHPIDGCDKLTPSFADGMFPIVTLSSTLLPWSLFFFRLEPPPHLSLPVRSLSPVRSSGPTRPT